MNSKSNIFCIFEGEKRELDYFNTLKKIYFSESSILVCSYGNDIYELFREIKKDEDLDIVELLRESKNVSSNKEILRDYGRDDFSQVFLFFDVECQDDQFDSGDFLSLIDVFNEETESGKIFVSYPMIEAIRDIPTYEEYFSHKVTVDQCVGKKYKSLSVKGLKLFNDPRFNIKKDWDQLVKINIEKGNYMVFGTKEDTTSVPEQKAIAEKQMCSIEKEGNMFVLSSYPFFIFHQKPYVFSF